MVVEARTGITSKKVSEILGRREVPDEHFELFLAAVVGRQAEVQVVARCLEGLEEVREAGDLSEEELSEVERGIREAERVLRPGGRRGGAGGSVAMRRPTGRTSSGSPQMPLGQPFGSAPQPSSGAAGALGQPSGSHPHPSSAIGPLHRVVRKAPSCSSRPGPPGAKADREVARARARRVGRIAGSPVRRRRRVSMTRARRVCQIWCARRPGNFPVPRRSSHG